MSSNKLFEAAAEILAGSKSKSSADPMQKPSSSVEDLGGPTPQNSKPDDDSAKLKQATKSSAVAPTTKPSDASAKMEDKDSEGDIIAEKMHDDEKEDKAMMKKMKMKEKMKEDMDALFTGENLSEEFVSKATTIFEAAVIARAEEVIAEAEEALTEQFEAAIEEIKEEMATKVDDYLNI